MSSSVLVQNKFNQLVGASDAHWAPASEGWSRVYSNDHVSTRRYRQLSQEPAVQYKEYILTEQRVYGNRLRKRGLSWDLVSRYYSSGVLPFNLYYGYLHNACDSVLNEEIISKISESVVRNPDLVPDYIVNDNPSSGSGSVPGPSSSSKEVVLSTYSRSFIEKLIKFRTLHELSQVDLNVLLNLPVNTVKNIENHSGYYDGRVSSLVNDFIENYHGGLVSKDD